MQFSRDEGKVSDNNNTNDIKNIFEVFMEFVQHPA